MTMFRPLALGLAGFLWAVCPAAAQWSGAYVGISGGYGWGHSGQTDNGSPTPPPIGDGHFGLHGGVLGGGVGYNWQQNNWVFGLETDFSWADISGDSNSCGPFPSHSCGTKIDTIGTVRARLGQDFNGTLAYLTGGFAYGEVKGWDSLTPASGSEYRGGWTLGAGLERKFAPNWGAKLEYLYVDLGDDHLFNIVPGVPESVSARAHIVRFGLNYYFGGPVVAKY